MPVGQVHHERVRAPSALDATMADSPAALRTLVPTLFLDGGLSFLVGKVDCEGVPAVRALVWLSHTRPLAGYALAIRSDRGCSGILDRCGEANFGLRERQLGDFAPGDAAIPSYTASAASSSSSASATAGPRVRATSM